MTSRVGLIHGLNSDHDMKQLALMFDTVYITAFDQLCRHLEDFRPQARAELDLLREWGIVEVAPTYALPAEVQGGADEPPSTPRRWRG